MSDKKITTENIVANKQFITLLVPNQRRILAFILSLVPNKADAEDIFQMTLIQMWDSFDRFEPGTDFVAWAVTIARYKVYDFRKKVRGTKLQYSDELARLLEIESDRRFNAIPEKLRALRGCVKKLSMKDAKFLKLRYENDLSLQKIATRTGITFQAVHKSISVIHARLVRCVRLTMRREEAL